MDASTKFALMSQIHSTTALDVTIKHINVRRNGEGQTLLWLTLKSSVSQLGPRTVLILRKVERAVEKFFGQSLGVTKLDVTIDLKGSFLPSSGAKDLIKEKL